MDNEEIRKLLLELKESSDESSSVRSKIVKIHFDTPREAEQRERAKKRAAEKEARRLAEEEARAQAEAEEKRLEAQKAIDEAVEAAKREAKAGFAPDLEETLSADAAPGAQDEAGEPEKELELNWGYEKPQLTSGLVKEEDLDLGPKEPGRWKEAFQRGKAALKRVGAGGSAEDGENQEGSEESGEAKNRFSLRGLFGRRQGQGNQDSGDEGSASSEENEAFSSDEEEFRSNEEDRLPESEQESITGLPGVFGALSDRFLSFARGVGKSMKEDLSKAKNRHSSTEEKEREEEDSGRTGDGNAAGNRSEEKDPADLGNGVRVGKDPDWGTDSDERWSRKASPDPSKEMRELPSYWEDGGDEEDDFPDDSSKDPSGRVSASGNPHLDEEWKRRMEEAEAPKKKSVFRSMSKRLELAAEASRGSRRKEREKNKPKAFGRKPKTESEMREAPEQMPEMTEEVSVQTPPQKAKAFEEVPAQKTEWSEEVPARKTEWSEEASVPKAETFEEVPVQKAETFEEAPVQKAETFEEAPVQEEDSYREGPVREEADPSGEGTLEEEEARAASFFGKARKRGNRKEKKRSTKEILNQILGSKGKAGGGVKGRAGDPADESGKAEPVHEAWPDLDPSLDLAASLDMQTVQDGEQRVRDSAQTLQDGAQTLRDGAQSQDSAQTGQASGMEAPGDGQDLRSIEVIDLNENENNKESEVIPLEGNTGSLPDPAQLKKERKAQREKSIKALKSSAAGAKPMKPGAFFSRHKKQLLIGIVVLAAVAAGIAAFFLLRGRFTGGPKETITADEGMTVKVLEQPDSYSKAGDVRIRIKTPETIQSVTVNGENVVIEQGRTVEFTYHANGGTLEIMAVCTDKVRNAKVILAYVDAQPPVVTIREKEGKIELSAEDTESGLAGIYIGTTNGISDIPIYHPYKAPLDKDPNKEISYYAADLAGNKTTPVVVALTPAESIEFEQARYSLFPGTPKRISLVTTPEHSFVNNLKLEAEDPKIVQIEGDMQIRGMAEGDTRITATADGVSDVTASVSVSAERKVTLSAIGDCTLGTDANFSQNTSFDAFEALYGDSYFFEKVKGILGADDTTFANLEGTLTTSDQREQKTYAFKGDPSYTRILQDGSIDVVNLANNHSRDYGEQSFTDTQHALEEAGIEWCEGDHIAYRDLNGVKTAYIGIYALENGLDKLPQVKSTIAEAKKEGAELIIVEFHWGAELVAQVDDFQKELAHTAVDEGANLVLGSHAHVLQGIEKYNGSYIVYGLGNFCFGGNSNPTSYDTMIWQQTFTFTQDGLASGDDISIIPCQVSGDLSSNNYQPVPVSGDAAANIMQTIDKLSAEFGQSYSAYMVDGTLWTDSGKASQ